MRSPNADFWKDFYGKYTKFFAERACIPVKIGLKYSVRYFEREYLGGCYATG